MQTDPAKVEHLYVHVPFCAAKCHYCAFYSEAGSAARMDDYVDAVLAELSSSVAALGERGRYARIGNNDRAHRARLQPSTIFFGGGTPSLLPASLMRRMLEGIHETVFRKCGADVSSAQSDTNAQTDTNGQTRRLPHIPVREWTIECNPSTVSTEKAKLFREFGVNRISMGVQALDDEMLDVIGRVHSVKGAIESYEKLRAAGFDNINLDLMFGLPGQTIEHFRSTLRRAIELQPEHLSTYCLILEEDTEFWRLFGKGLIKPDEELELAMYELAMEMLDAAGYRQYEISNFAKPGRKCAHNIAYWEGKEYLGLGPSACSTIGDRRWQNIPDLDRYIAALKSGAGVSPVSSDEHLPPALRAAECAAFGMRMNNGVPAALVQGRWDREIAELLSAELVQWHNGRLQPTKRGILFADEVAAEFV